MKSKILFLITAGLLMGACTSEDEIFSCDKEVNNWVKNNLKEIRTMDREDWLNSSSEAANAMYRAFTPTQRLVFWNDKFEELMLLPWTNEELGHICKAQEFVNFHKEIFSNELSIEERDDIIDAFCYKWMEFAMDELGWDELKVRAVIGSGRKVLNTNGDLALMKNTTRTSILSEDEEEDSSCNCNQKHDFCNGSSECMSDSGCGSSEHGCGWLILQSCNGRCGIYGYGPA